MRAFILHGMIPAFCLTLVLNLAIKAQTAPADSPIPSIPEAPKIGPIVPEVDLSVVPAPPSFPDLEFEEPDANSKNAPRAFQATAYSLRGRTASGVETRQGIVAADPRVLPLGSVIELKAGNYSGVYTVHDTGSAVKGNLVDVWMPSTKEARKFGRRSVKLQVIRYGPEARTKKTK